MRITDPPVKRRRAGPTRWVLRGLAASVPVGLLALLIYGVMAQSPNTSIDDALSRGQTTIAPSFRLDVLQTGSLGTPLQPKLVSVFGRPAAALNGQVQHASRGGEQRPLR